MTAYAYTLGNVTARGPEALILRNGSVVGCVSMAYAPESVDRLNAASSPEATPNQRDGLHEIILELHAMLTQAIESRERDGFTGTESDDSKRARQLLERAGAICHGVIP